MAGYSGTPLVKKLGIRPGARVLLVEAPDGYDRTLGQLPEGVRQYQRAVPHLDLIQLFARDQRDLTAKLDRVQPSLAQDGALWVSWPKRASGIKTDLDGNVVRETGLARGLVDIKVCAVDEIWSGLKFVIPVKDRR